MFNPSLISQVSLPARRSGVLPVQSASMRQAPRQPGAAGRPPIRNMGLPKDTFTLSPSTPDIEPPQTSQILPFAAPMRRMPISEIAEKLAKQYGKNYGAILQEIRHALAGKGQLSGRVKSPASIGDKLIRLARQEGLAEISETWAATRIPDAIGFRLTLRKGNPDDMDASIQSLAELIHTKKIKLLEVRDYHGPGTPSYLSDSNLQILVGAWAKAQHRSNSPVETLKVIHQTPAAIKPSGYTALQLKVRFSDGTPGELQIRGPEVEKVAAVEHLVYDIRKGKTLPGRNAVSYRGLDRGKLEAAIRTLSPAQSDDYLRYLAGYYQKARLMETGQKPTDFPVLPDSLRRFPLLDLRRLHGGVSLA